MEMSDNIRPKRAIGELGIVTSYESTVFFVKRGKFLFVSGEYALDKNPLLATYAFVGAATGRYASSGADFILPTPNIDWLKTKDKNWKKQLKAYPKSGIPSW